MRRRPREANTVTASRLDSMVRALGRTLTIPELPGTHDALSAFLGEIAMDDRDRAALLAIGPKRISVYRSLVRGTLTTAIQKQLTETCTLLGERLDGEIAAFFATGMPRSHYLFDVAFEFIEARAARWAEDPTLPPFLCDLARFELTDFRVAAIRAPRDRDDVVPELSLDAPLVIHEAHRLETYAYPVHAFVRGEGLEPAATRVLTYRDGDDDIGHLELDPATAAVFERLAAGATVRQALEGAAALGTPLPIEHASQFFADLAERCVLLGTRQPPLGL